MYQSSTHYKDACEVGKIEYSAAYRTLIWMVKAKQKNIDWAEKLAVADFRDIILVGAGDLCDILLEELKLSDVQICGIIESNIAKYEKQYPKGLLMRIEEVEPGFFVGKKVIVTYMNRYGEWVSKLQDKGVKVDDIVSLEEVISYLLLKK